MARRIHLVALGDGVRLSLLDGLAAALAKILRLSCHVDTEALDAAFAHDLRRNQYYATAMLRRLRQFDADEETCVLGVTAHDLFVPVLTFVFGEAELGGRCAVVSLQRLDERFYGMPAREELLLERLVKEGVHELGHTFGLRHCNDWRCVMTSSHAVEKLDVKSERFCAACGQWIAARTA